MDTQLDLGERSPIERTQLHTPSVFGCFSIENVRSLKKKKKEIGKRQVWASDVFY